MSNTAGDDPVGVPPHPQAWREVSEGDQTGADRGQGNSQLYSRWRGDRQGESRLSGGQVFRLTFGFSS